MAIKILALDGLADIKLCRLVEELLCTVPGIEDAHIEFLSQKLTLTVTDENNKQAIDKAIELVRQSIPHVSVRLTDTAEEKKKKAAEAAMKRKRADVREELETMLPEKAESLVIDEDIPEHELPERMRLTLVVGGLAVVCVLLMYLMGGNHNSRMLFSCLSFCLAVAANIAAGTDERTNPGILHYPLIGVLTLSFFLEQPHWVVLALIIYLASVLAARNLLFKLREAAHNVTSDICPDTVIRMKENEDTEKVHLNMVSVGDILVINEGDVIPFTGVLHQENAAMVRSYFSSQEPREVEPSGILRCGDQNLSGQLLLRVNLNYPASAVAYVNENVAQGSFDNTPLSIEVQNKRHLVLLGGCLAAILLPHLFYGMQYGSGWFLMFTRFFAAILFPCGLSSSASVIQQCGVIKSIRQGFLPGSAKVLAQLARVKHILLSYTGFLSDDNYNVDEIQLVEDIDIEEFLDIAGCAFASTEDPIGKKIANECVSNLGRAVNTEILDYVDLIEGYGIHTSYNHKSVLIGSEKLMEEMQITCPPNPDGRPRVYVTILNEIVGIFVLSNKIYPGTRHLFNKLKQWRSYKVGLLSTNDPSVVRAAAVELNANMAYSAPTTPEWIKTVESVHGGKKDELLFAGLSHQAERVKGECICVDMGVEDPDTLPGVMDILSVHNTPQALERLLSMSKFINDMVSLCLWMFVIGKTFIFISIVHWEISLFGVMIMNALLAALIYAVSATPLLADRFKQTAQEQAAEEAVQDTADLQEAASAPTDDDEQLPDMGFDDQPQIEEKTEEN
ncbi:MAG: hypothetical protein IKV41_06610 [Oscillospiraceae bacterium]|nr:hypothetical protein [Oscillospiraceae bacterium]